MLICPDWKVAFAIKLLTVNSIELEKTAFHFATVKCQIDINTFSSILLLLLYSDKIHFNFTG